MPSLVELPEEVLINICSYLDAATLTSLACMNPRLLLCAAHCTKRLKVSCVTPHLRNILSRSRAIIHSLDLSNCHSETTAIQNVIPMCQSIRELNIVNCNLPFSQLRRLLPSLTQLDTLSFTLFDVEEPLMPQEETRLDSGFSIRRLYVELDPSQPSAEVFTTFLNECISLEELRVMLFWLHSPYMFRKEAPWKPLEPRMWQHLKTVIIYGHSNGRLWLPVVLPSLFGKRLEQTDVDHCKRMGSPCFIYQNGNLSTRVPIANRLDEFNAFRDTYHIEIECPPRKQISFPYGKPRGLRIDCKTVGAAEYASLLFLGPIEWSSDMVELDLTECHSNLPRGADWLTLIGASPALESIGIPSCFLRPVPFLDNSGPRSFLDFLARKLKRLLITGSCPACSSVQCFVNAFSPSFISIENLPRLEELTLYNVSAAPSILTTLGNENVRVVRLSLTEVSDLYGFLEFIKKSKNLRYFKLEMPNVPLGCNYLWRCLAQSKTIEQFCIETHSSGTVSLSAIRESLPRILEKVTVFHVHALKIDNRTQLRETIQDIVKEFLKDHPHREVHFESGPISPTTEEADAELSLYSPGRSLCWISDHLTMIKRVGWDLSSGRTRSDDTSAEAAFWHFVS